MLRNVDGATVSVAPARMGCAMECAMGDAKELRSALCLVLCWLRVGARVVLPCPYAVHAAHVFSRGVCSWRGRPCSQENPTQTITHFSEGWPARRCRYGM